MRAWAYVWILGLLACTETESNIAKDAVVSTTLCADGYVHAFPELEPRLAALSWQSRTSLSLTPKHLRALPQTDTDPERAVQWNDAIRISSAGGSGDIDLKWGESFETIWENLGHLSRSLNLADPSAQLKARLQSLNLPETTPTILYLNRSGATAGPGTFVDEVIQIVGAANIVETPGWQSPDTETLIRYQPDIILTSFMDSDYAGVNDHALRHSALAQKIASVPHIHIPGKYWPCAGPALVDAAEHLSRALTTL